PLRCTYQTRAQAYQSADVYLCLSLSEGGSFAMCDAEAAVLPIVSTDVGNYREFEPVVIRWQERDDPLVVRLAIERALDEKRRPSFYESWTLKCWTEAWAELIARARDSAGTHVAGQ